jgi:hypothetical protein
MTDASTGGVTTQRTADILFGGQSDATPGSAAAQTLIAKRVQELAEAEGLEGGELSNALAQIGQQLSGEIQLAAAKIDAAQTDEESIAALTELEGKVEVFLDEYVEGTGTTGAVDGQGTVTAARPLNTSLIMQRLAAVVASSMEVMNEMKALLSMSSMQDILSAQAMSLKAAEQDKEAAADQKKASVLTAWAEIATGLGQVAAGLGNVAGGAAGGKAGGKSQGATGMALSGGGEACQGVATIISGAIKMAAAGYQFSADMHRAESKIYSALAQTSSSMASRSESSANNLQQLVQGLVSALKSFADALNQTTMGIIQNFPR